MSPNPPSSPALVDLLFLRPRDKHRHLAAVFRIFLYEFPEQPGLFGQFHEEEHESHEQGHNDHGNPQAGAKKGNSKK